MVLVPQQALPIARRVASEASQGKAGRGPVNLNLSTPENPLALANWCQRVAEMYAAVRQAPEPGRLVAWQDWRATRNDLFRTHPQSPLKEKQQSRFRCLDYFNYDPEWRVVGRIERAIDRETRRIQLGADGEIYLTKVAEARFEVKGFDGKLFLYWIEGYGGGLFLPFKDETNGRDSYRGGRYLLDTIKGVDLDLVDDSIVLDFNYAYNPSCAYHPRWVCPLSPQENALPFAVTAGEKKFATNGR